jgi:hypothetical protein
MQLYSIAVLAVVAVWGWPPVLSPKKLGEKNPDDKSGTVYGLRIIPLPVSPLLSRTLGRLGTQ